MASLNRSRPQLPPQGGQPPRRFEPSNTMRTHEGAPAALISPELELRRSVCSCLLWEGEFYEDGKSIASRIADLASRVQPQVLADLAYDVRTHFNLRHVPLLLTAILAKTHKGRLVGDTIERVIQRADELSEFVVLYAQVNGVAPSQVKKKMSAQVKKGLGRAFVKFDQFALGRYFSASGEKKAVVRGRDVMFLCHPKPKDEAQAKLFEAIAKKEPIAEGGVDTWETALSAGADKKETWERLLREGKLGYLALLRNLRNMEQANVDRQLVEEAIVARKGGAHRVLPFRFVAASRAAPYFNGALDQSMRKSIEDLPALPGVTTILVDVSGSMDTQLSARSDMTRMDAAAALACIIRGDKHVYSFSEQLARCADTNQLNGLLGITHIINSQRHAGTRLGAAVADVPVTDRLIVITDEQAHDHVGNPGFERAYMVNVASYQNGVGYGENWVHLDGFSENVIRFIHEFENLKGTQTNVDTAQVQTDIPGSD